MKHVYEKVFTSDSGMRRNVPKVLVVVTDGRSQDDVKKSAEKLQHSGTCGIIDHCQVRFGVYFTYNAYGISQICFESSQFADSFNLLHQSQSVWLIYQIPSAMKLLVVTGSLTIGLCYFCVRVFCPHRLQCVCRWSSWCGHDRAETYWQQAQRETCVCGRRLWRFRQDPGQPYHLHLWNGHF